MLAVLYLLLCAIFGLSLVSFCVPDIRRLYTAASPSKSIASKIPGIVFSAPAGMVTGIMLVAITNYALISGCSKFIAQPDLCKRVAVLITFAIFVILTATNITLSIRRKEKADDSKSSLIPEFTNSVGALLYYGFATVLFTLVASFLMFYTYNLTGGELLAGYSTFSDLAPHTAMTSSFGVGFNFPTQYMHYSGDGIQYHFLFYFFCGILQYLGLPIDWAINLPSIIAMVCAFELLGLLAVLISRRQLSFFIAPVLVLFRSSFNAFYHIHDLRSNGIPLKAALQSIMQSTQWYKVTPYDDWGIWAINVYPNQRHLLLGVSCMLVFIILLTPFVRRMCISCIKSDGFGSKCKTFFISKEGWLWRKEDPLNPLGVMILTSLIAITMPYFHGSALIGSLLVLLGMAIISESRIIYACIAATAVISSFIQTRLFSGSAGNVVKMQHITGFVVENKTPQGIANYLVIVTGLTLIIAILYAVYLLIRDIIKKKPVYRSLLLIAFILPLIFAFNFQVSLEMLANHKFIQFTLILSDAYVAGAISELFCLPLKRRSSKLSDEENAGRISLPLYIICQTVSAIIACVLIVPLVATGITEWATYINLNKYHYVVDAESEVTKWIEENTDPQDVFLTPYTWSLNRFYLAGRPSYYGWPYYAWSAGHDTLTRDRVYYWLLSGCYGDIDRFRSYCQERGIRYLVDDPEFLNMNYPAGMEYDPEFFVQNLTPVAYFSNEGTIIYQIY